MCDLKFKPVSFIILATRVRCCQTKMLYESFAAAILLNSPQIRNRIKKNKRSRATLFIENMTVLNEKEKKAFP